MKRRFMKRVAGVLLGAVMLAGSAWAGPELLPAETVFAFGINDGSAAWEYLEPFAEKWNELGLTEAADVPPELEDADLLGLLGESAWIGVAASSSNPIPTGFGIFRVSGQFREFAENMLAEAATDEDTLTLTEGDQTFYLLEIDEEETEDLIEGIAAALTPDGLLVFTSGSDAMRGVLRRAAGSDEPSFATSPSYLATAALADDTMFTFMDVARIGRIASAFGRPFVQQLELGGLLDELEGAFEAAGVLASGVSFTADGVYGHGLQLVGESSSAVRSLLLERGTVPGSIEEDLPGTTLSYGRAFTNAAGWWDWLNSLLASVPELGLGDLNSLVASFIGVDPQEGIFSWLGGDVRVITTDFPDTAGIGMASDNMLGSMVYVLETSDEATASASLDNLFFMGSMMATSMLSLDGTEAPPEPAVSDVAGVSVTTYDFADGLSISYGVGGGNVYVATDPGALSALLEGTDGGSDLSRLVDNIPADVSSFSVADYSATISAAGEQLASQIGLLAGLSGEDLDFEQLEEFSSGLAAFFEFVASRTGGMQTWTRVDGDTLVTEMFVEVDW